MNRDDAALPEADDLWYLSFCDPEVAATIPKSEQRPGGPSWLGACIVPGFGEIDAIRNAHALGCNPGGQVATLGPFPPAAIKPDYIGRLLNAEEAEAAGA